MARRSRVGARAQLIVDLLATEGKPRRRCNVRDRDADNRSCCTAPFDSMVKYFERVTKELRIT
jgi:hypothetical protein